MRRAALGVTWYEEPAGPESAETLRAFRERLPSNVPICVGERHYTRHGFRPVLENHICDVIMPDMSGRDLRQRLGDLRPGLKCLFMSGYTANVIAHHGVLDDGVHFLQKPFSRETLAAKLREALYEP